MSITLYLSAIAWRNTFEGARESVGVGKAGASGYMVKTVREGDLLAAVRAIHNAPAAVAKLSERELEVLQLLAQGHTNQAVFVMET
jgi:DNA-binding NarL/FixJ family response regulator